MSARNAPCAQTLAAPMVLLLSSPMNPVLSLPKAKLYPTNQKEMVAIAMLRSDTQRYEKPPQIASHSPQQVLKYARDDVLRRNFSHLDVSKVSVLRGWRFVPHLNEHQTRDNTEPDRSRHNHPGNIDVPGILYRLKQPVRRGSASHGCSPSV